MRKAFTLIEVMVSVIIISVVIMALLQMRGNSSHIFLELGKRIEINQFASFIIGNNNYGFENKATTLDKLLDDFEVDSDLRRKLKRVKVKILYRERERIDMSEDSDEDVNSSTVFEIGKTILKTEKSSVSFLRLKL